MKKRFFVFAAVVLVFLAVGAVSARKCTLEFGPVSQGTGSVSSHHDLEWANARSGTSGAMIYKTSFLRPGTGILSGNTYYVSRSFLSFDTRAISSGAITTGAKLTMDVSSQAYANEDNDGNDFLVLVRSLQDYPTSLLTSDFNRVYPYEISDRVDISGLSFGDAVEFTLKTSGTFGFGIERDGWAKLAIREGHDLLNDEPIGLNEITFSSPKLSLTYLSSTYDGGIAVEHSCSDGIDNDCDGCIDEIDPDCGNTETIELDCYDGIDNDCDGLVDMKDPDCESAGGKELSCSDEQRMFAISDYHYAYAELWDEKNYLDWQICFNEFFQGDYNPGSSNPHDCITENGNIMLRFSDYTNAYVEFPTELFTFPNEVCYGDLSCEIKDKNTETCETVGEHARRGSIIVSLSKLTGADVSLGYISEGYDYQLCCVSDSFDAICNYEGGVGGSDAELPDAGEICDEQDGEDCYNCPTDCLCPEIGECVITDSDLSWRNSIDDEISKTRNGRKVYASVENLECAGKTLDIEIFKVGEPPTLVQTSSGLRFSPSPGGVVKAEWIANIDSSANNKENFYFKATLTEGGEPVVSDNLEVTKCPTHYKTGDTWSPIFQCGDYNFLDGFDEEKQEDCLNCMDGCVWLDGQCQKGYYVEDGYCVLTSSERECGENDIYKDVLYEIKKYSFSPPYSVMTPNDCAIQLVLPSCPFENTKTCTVQVLCPLNVILPFFSFQNLVITAVVLGVIYFLYVYRKIIFKQIGKRKK